MGKAGDMFLIRRGKRLDLIGADLDVKSMLGTVGLKSSVDYTIVNGKIVVENGHLVNIDEEKFISEARKSVTDYLSRSLSTVKNKLLIHCTNFCINIYNQSQEETLYESFSEFKNKKTKGAKWSIN